MATRQKQPTNADIMQKLDELGTRLKIIEDWRIAVEAAKEALKEYQLNHQPEERGGETISNKALAAVIAALVAVTGVVGIVASKL